MEYIDHFPDCKGCMNLCSDAQYVYDEISIWWYCSKHTEGRLKRNCKERDAS